MSGPISSTDIRIYGGFITGKLPDKTSGLAFRLESERMCAPLPPSGKPFGFTQDGSASPIDILCVNIDLFHVFLRLPSDATPLLKDQASDDPEKKLSEKYLFVPLSKPASLQPQSSYSLSIHGDEEGLVTSSLKEKETTAPVSNEDAELEAARIRLSSSGKKILPSKTLHYWLTKKERALTLLKRAISDWQSKGNPENSSEALYVRYRADKIATLEKRIELLRPPPISLPTGQ